MAEKNWEVLISLGGELNAEILRGLLEAQGIEVILSQEGIGHSVYPVSVGLFGKVDILVPASQKEQALQVLKDYEAGAYQTPEEDTDAEDSPAES